MSSKDLKISRTSTSLSEKEFVERMSKVLEKAINLKISKMHDYGVSFEEGHKYGIKGNFIDIARKFYRLETLVWKEKDPKVNESIADTYEDLLNYVIDGLMMSTR